MLTHCRPLKADQNLSPRPNSGSSVATRLAKLWMHPDGDTLGHGLDAEGPFTIDRLHACDPMIQSWSSGILRRGSEDSYVRVNKAFYASFLG